LGCRASERSDRALLDLATKLVQRRPCERQAGRSAFHSAPRHGDGSFRPHVNKGGSEGHSTSYQATSRSQDSSLRILSFEIGFSNGGTSLWNRPEASANPKMCATIDWAPSTKMRHRNRYSSCSRSDAALPSLISNQDAADTTRHASRSGTFLPLPSPHQLPGNPLLLPERIARSVQVDHPSVCKHVRQHWVGLATDEARLPRRSADDGSDDA